MTIPSFARRVGFTALTLALVLLLLEGGARLIGALIVTQHRDASSSGAGLRVIALGDSWAWGYGVQPQETWAFQLPAVLAQMGGPSIRVINGASPGGTPLDAARSLNRAVNTIEPQVALVLVGQNREVEDDLSNRVDPGLAGLRPYLGAFATYRLLTQAVWRARIASDPVIQKQLLEGRPPRLPQAGEGIVESLEERERKLREGFERIYQIAVAYDVELVVLNYAMPPVLLQDPMFADGVVNKRLEKVVGELGLPLIDVQSVYLERGIQGPEVTIDGAAGLTRRENWTPGGAGGDPRAGGYELHPNALGHAIYAETIAAWWVQNGPR